MIENLQEEQKKGDNLVNLQDYIRDYLTVTDRDISVTGACHDVTDRLLCDESLRGVTTGTDRDKAKIRTNIRQTFYRMKGAGKLRAGPKEGAFEKIDSELREIKWEDIDPVSESLVLPLGLSLMADIYSGSIVLIAGARNSGKTCLMLNLIRDNMFSYETFYFNSELGDAELAKRLRGFTDTDIRDWKFHAYERTGDFASAIKQSGEPGPGKLYLIDYLEIYENFFRVGHYINEIHEVLNGAVAVIALQKPTGRDTGVGGEFTLDKPRLAIALDQGVAKITKLKNWKGEANPNGKSCIFQIIGGARIKQTTKWVSPEEN